MKQKKEKTPEKAAAAPPPKGDILNVRFLVIIWGTVFLVLIVAFIVGQVSGEFAKGSTFPLISAITSFAAFIVQSLFSFSVLKHNAMVRDMSDEVKKSTDDINARAESFRTLQFIADNYSVVEFADYMLLYEESERYTAILKKTKDFTVYLREDNVDEKDIFEHFDDYQFLTVKIPFTAIEGKTIGKIKFSRFKFVKDCGDHRFVSCGGPADSLILYNETDKRSEVVVNLIVNKTSGFYAADKVIPFLKIKISLTMQSLLGVAVKGWIELYFTNPRKLEESGANKYKILSSHFEISGLPTLVNAVGEDIKTI